MPAGLTVRAWHLAATVAKDGNDPDWTVGVKLRRDRPAQFLVLDVIRLRGTARQIEQAVLTAARLDGGPVHIGFSEDPGQAGKSRISQYVGPLAGYHVVATRESGSEHIPARCHYHAGSDVTNYRSCGGIGMRSSRRNYAVFRTETRMIRPTIRSDILPPSIRYPAPPAG